MIITKTYRYNFDSLKPHFYIAELGFTYAWLFFLFLLKNIDCGYSLSAVVTSRHNLCFKQKYETIRIFTWKLIYIIMRTEDGSSLAVWTAVYENTLLLLTYWCVTCLLSILKTRLFKYIANFTTKKNWKFSGKNSEIFHISAQTIKHRLWVLVRITSPTRF